MKKRWRKTGTVGIILLSLILTIFLIRLVNPSELDDLTPEIPCEESLIENADILWVIPNFENHPISENKEWCERILSMNKTLGMHGITHSYKEFGNDITLEEIKNGMEIFRKCFGFYPTMFKPPQLTISKKNKGMIEENSMELMVGANQMRHKVYHCNDSDVIKNGVVNIF